MNFSFSCIFKINAINEFETSSIFQLNGKILWNVQLLIDGKKNIHIVLFGNPYAFDRPGVCWEISADVEGTVGGTIIRRKQLFFKKQEAKLSVGGTSLYQREENAFKSDGNIVKNGEIALNLKIRRISSNGIRVFQQLEYYNPNLLRSDLTLSIGKLKLFCHSQILILGSPVFAQILIEKSYSRNNPLRIRLDPTKSVDDFLEFLHQLYSVGEPIRDDNWEILLHFAGIYEASQILFCCENFLLSKLLETQALRRTMKAIEILPLSCRYGMDSLAAKCVEYIFPCTDRKLTEKIMANEHFVAMNDIRKAELLNFLILRISCKSPVVNNWITDHPEIFDYSEVPAKFKMLNPEESTVKSIKTLPGSQKH